LKALFPHQWGYMSFVCSFEFGPKPLATNYV
jgi:hypothetical protein